MLKDYLEKLQDQRRNHPITQADFDAWRQNIITKQFFEDLELFPVDRANDITADNANTAGLHAAKLNGVQDTCEYFSDWTPDCLEGNEDE